MSDSRESNAGHRESSSIATKPPELVPPPPSASTKTLLAPTAHLVDQYFEVWWGGVWRKDGKLPAKKAYRAAVKRGNDVAALAAGRDKYKRWLASQPEDYTPLLPATFLNQERWDDERLNAKGEEEQSWI